MPGSPEGLPTARPPLVIGCGALARELVELTRHAGLPAMDLACLPASLHNRPERIPDRVFNRIRRARAEGYDRIFVAYADCGTGGLLDAVLEREAVARLEGAHCYEVYAGRAAFAALSEAEPGTFYLTDYLVRNFDRLVIRGLGLDRHPELLSLYFGNYRRLVYLAQAEDAALTRAAERAAERLGLAFERRFVGLGELAGAVEAFARERLDASSTSAARSTIASVPPGTAVEPPTTVSTPRTDGAPSRPPNRRLINRRTQVAPSNPPSTQSAAREPQGRPFSTEGNQARRAARQRAARQRAAEVA